MGVSTIPSATSGASLPTGATALVASGTASLGFYQTTSLAAGTYAVVMNPYTNKNAGLSVGTTDPTFQSFFSTMASSQVNTTTVQNSGAAYITLAASDTLTVSNANMAVNPRIISSVTTGALVSLSASSTGTIVANGTASSIGFSTDTITWNSGVTIVTTAGYYPTSYAGTNIYLLGQTTTATTSPLIGYSTNGTIWTYNTSNLPAGNYSITGFAYDGATYVAVSNSITTASISTSVNGTTWSTRYLASTALSGGIVWGSSGKFVAVGDNIIVQSTDGITWSTRTPVFSSGESISYNTSNGYYFIGSNSTLKNKYSTNGTTWTASVVGKSIGYRQGQLGATPVTSSGSYFYGYEQATNNLCISTDGNYWNPIATNKATQSPVGNTSAYLSVTLMGYHPTQGLLTVYGYSGGSPYLVYMPATYVSIYSVAGTTLN